MHNRVKVKERGAHILFSHLSVPSIYPLFFASEIIRTNANLEVSHGEGDMQEGGGHEELPPDSHDVVTQQKKKEKLKK